MTWYWSVQYVNGNIGANCRRVRTNSFTVCLYLGLTDTCNLVCINPQFRAEPFVALVVLYYSVIKLLTAGQQLIIYLKESCFEYSSSSPQFWMRKLYSQLRAWTFLLFVNHTQKKLSMHKKCNFLHYKHCPINTSLYKLTNLDISGFLSSLVSLIS